MGNSKTNRISLILLRYEAFGALGERLKEVLHNEVSKVAELDWNEELEVLEEHYPWYVYNLGLLCNTYNGSFSAFVNHTKINSRERILNDREQFYQFLYNNSSVLEDKDKELFQIMYKRLIDELLAESRIRKQGNVVSRYEL